MYESLERKLNKLIGKKCRIETRDGMVRFEKVAKVKYLDLEVGGTKACWPVELSFDLKGLDGVDLRMVISVKRI